MPNRPFVAFSLLCLLSLLAFSSALSSALAVDASEAGARIQLARTGVVSSYEATAQAESAGANVSVLLEALNQAGAFLSEADLAYAQGRYDVAVGLADQSIIKLAGIDSEAARLGTDAWHARTADFMVNVVGSVVATVCVVAGSYGLWLWLKKRRVPGSAKAGQLG